jgi:uncharacterized membrane protein YhhN
MPRLTARARATVLAGLYAALGIANSASAAKRFRAGEWAAKPLLMPVLAAFALVAAGDRRQEMRLPAAGIAMSGLGDTALLGPEAWFVPGMGAFFVASDALIACGLAGINAFPRQESAVRPTYIAAQFLLAAGFLRPQRATAKP